MKRPLEGITVVGLEQVIAGPFCTRQPAELGEHSRAILSDLGFTSREFHQMEESGIIQQGGKP